MTKTLEQAGIADSLRKRLKPTEIEIRKLGHQVQYTQIGTNALHAYCLRCHCGADITTTVTHVYLNNEVLRNKCDPAIKAATHEALCIIIREATGHRQRVYRHKKTNQLYAEYIRDDNSSGPNHMLTPQLFQMVVSDLHYGLLKLESGTLPPEIKSQVGAMAKEAKRGKKGGAKKALTMDEFVKTPLAKKNEASWSKVATKKKGRTPARRK